MQLGEEILDREKALEAMLLFPLGIQDDPRGSPLGPESFEALRLLFYVDFYRNEILTDESGNAVIGVNLGFQPSTPRSHRSGAEVQEDRPPALFRLRQRGIGIANPVYLHVISIVHSAEKWKRGSFIHELHELHESKIRVIRVIRG